MTNKQDQILNCILDVQKDVGEINGHLKALNGSVKRNVNDIHNNATDIKLSDKRVDKIENKVYYLIGILVAIQIGIGLYFNLIK